MAGPKRGKNQGITKGEAEEIIKNFLEKVRPIMRGKAHVTPKAKSGKPKQIKRTYGGKKATRIAIRNQMEVRQDGKENNNPSQVEDNKVADPGGRRYKRVEPSKNKNPMKTFKGKDLP